MSLSEIPHASRIGLWAGLALFVLMLLAPAPEGMTPEAKRTAAVALLMASWWLTEAVHIAVTSLLPIALMPLLGVLSAQETTAFYGHHIVFLYFGGFVIAMAMERWNLHKRIALGTIRRVGSKPGRILLGFMIATAFLSMWISNTATTMMMLPIAIAVAKQMGALSTFEGRSDPETRERVVQALGVMLLLGVAYSASVGGIGTIIGSPTNLAFLGFVAEALPEEPQIGFADWSLVTIPIVIVFLPVAWLYLRRFGAEIPLSRIEFEGGVDVIEREQRALGGMSYAEKAVLVVAASTALLWITRSPLTLGAVTIPGWSSLFGGGGGLIEDSTVAMAMATLLFIIPARAGEDRPARLMDWSTVQTGMPWGIVLLFGGGFALASAISTSGLADWIGAQLSGLEGAPVWVLVPVSCLLAALLTETTSNIATVLMLSPVLAATAVQIGVHPYLLLLPAAIMASFAFMLPVATPPNAIVFSSGWITIARMFRVGLLLDVIALAVVPLMVYLLGGRLLSL